MNLKTYISFIISVVVLTSAVHAQNSEFKEDLVKIRETYKNVTNFSCNLRMASYETHSSSTALEQIAGEYVKQGRQSYFKTDQQEYISTMDYTLMIDHKSKMMSYYAKASFGVAKDRFTVELDSLLAHYDKISFVDAPSGKKAMLIENKNGYYKQIFFQYDKKTFFVENVKLYLDYSEVPTINNFNYWSSSTDNTNAQAAKPRMEIEYTNTSFEVTTKKELFQLSSYLIKNSTNRFVCTEPYKNYKLR